MTADLSNHPFSNEFIAYESGTPTAIERAWEGWVKRAERLLGHHLDGDDRGQDGDGYSLDEAYDKFVAKVTADEYVLEVKGRPRYQPPA